jgi:hypothetical protein
MRNVASRPVTARIVTAAAIRLISSAASRQLRRRIRAYDKEGRAEPLQPCARERATSREAYTHAPREASGVPALEGLRKG